MATATQAAYMGVQTVSHWQGVAARWRRQGNLGMERFSLLKALEIADSWGKQVDHYAAGFGVRERITNRLAEIDAG